MCVCVDSFVLLSLIFDLWLVDFTVLVSAIPLLLDSAFAFAERIYLTRLPPSYTFTSYLVFRTWEIEILARLF
jgi:hypothetical protein